MGNADEGHWTDGLDDRQAVRDRLREARAQQAPLETDHRSFRPAEGQRPAVEFVLSSPPGLAGPSAHETSAILRPRRRHRGRYSLGANKPASKLDPGFLEHLRLSPRAVTGPGARVLEFLFTGAPRRRRNPGGRHGTVASTLLRSRRSQRDGGGLPAPCS